MSLQDAMYWEQEFSTSKKTVWKNPKQDLPVIQLDDPDVKNRRTSLTVLVKVLRSEKAEPYVALAKYTSTADENSNNIFQWKIEHHTGDWDKKVVGWYSIPTAGD